LLQLLIRSLLLDRLDDLLETIAAYQCKQTKTSRPVLTCSLHRGRLYRSDTVASKRLHVTVDNAFFDHVAKERVQHRLHSLVRLVQSNPGRPESRTLSCDLFSAFSRSSSTRRESLSRFFLEGMKILPTYSFSPLM